MSFDFFNETTLVASACGINYKTECVYKFTRVDESSHEFKKIGETRIKNPTALRCIGNNIYVISDCEKLYWLNEDLENKELLFENKSWSTR